LIKPNSWDQNQFATLARHWAQIWSCEETNWSFSKSSFIKRITKILQNKSVFGHATQNNKSVFGHATNIISFKHNMEINGVDHSLQELCSQNLRKHSWKAVTRLLLSPKFRAEVQQYPRIEPCTLLHVACSLPSVSQEVVSDLIELFPGACLFEDEDGNLPIHCLCTPMMEGTSNPIRSDLIEMLLLACPETSFLPFQGEETPFYVLLKHFVQTQGVDRALELISSMPSNIIFNQYTSVLHQVCNVLPPERICQYIISQYPDLCRITHNGNTLLHVMCSHEQSTLPLIESIIGIYPEACSMQDEQGNLPLHLVNSNQHSLGIIRILIFHFPQGKLVRNFSGQIPLMSPSIQSSSMRVKELLRNSFAETNDVQAALNSCNQFGLGPLQDSYFSLQRRITDLFFQGKLSLGDLSSFGMTTNYTKLIANDLESFFYMMRASVYNNVEYSLDAPHNVSFWAAFPLFTKALLNHCPELACHQDSLGFFPLHTIAKHSFQPLMDCVCVHCNISISGPHFLYQNNARCCKQCTPCIPRHGPACFLEYQGTDLIKTVLAIYPQAAKAKDPEGNYPLHESIKSGKTWSTGVCELVHAAPSVLDEADGETNLYPFMLAAVGKGRDEGLETGDKLASIYELLRRNPSHFK